MASVSAGCTANSSATALADREPACSRRSVRNTNATAATCHRTLFRWNTQGAPPPKLWSIMYVSVSVGRYVDSPLSAK